MKESAATKKDPWFRGVLDFAIFDRRFHFAVPFDVFSNLQIDDGTKLLLSALPASAPKTVLDMGCGYGALGIPLAALYPSATFDLVDRDMLAARWSQHNAAAHELTNLRAYPSLGYSRVDPAKRFDWILCNVPARIGRPFIMDLFQTGCERLKPDGEIRVVVINDLCPVVESLEFKGLHKVLQGSRHAIYACNKSQAPSFAEGLGRISEEDLYRRDLVEFCGLKLERPFDMSGDTHRMQKVFPILLEALPKRPPKDLLCIRSLYGALPLAMCDRYPEARVNSWDRDLLALYFVEQNARRLGLDEKRLEVRQAVDVSEADPDLAWKVDLILGELNMAPGPKVLERDLRSYAERLRRGGQAIFIAPERLSREEILPMAKRLGLDLLPLISREQSVVLRMS